MGGSRLEVRGTPANRPLADVARGFRKVRVVPIADLVEGQATTLSIVTPATLLCAGRPACHRGLPETGMAR